MGEPVEVSQQEDDAIAEPGLESREPLKDSAEVLTESDSGAEDTTTEDQVPQEVVTSGEDPAADDDDAAEEPEGTKPDDDDAEEESPKEEPAAAEPQAEEEEPSEEKAKEEEEEEAIPPPPVEEPKTPMISSGLRYLKSKKPDLKIVLSAGTADSDDVPVKEEVRWYQSASMAEHCNYVDEQIEAMDQDEDAPKQPYEIRTIEVPAATWDLMMKWILDPIESRVMTAQDVLQVAEFYDRYDFPLGRKLCNRVLEEYFAHTEQNEAEMDIETVVDAVAMAYKAHLDGSYAIGNAFLKAKLKSM